VKKKAKCCSKYIRQELLVNQINKSFKKVLLSNILQKGLKNKVKEEKEIIKNDSQKELYLLNDSLKNVENQVSRLMDIYLEGEISKREYIKRKEKLIETQFKIRHQLNQLERGQYTWLERLEEFINGLDRIKTAIETDNLETKREFLEKIGSNFSLGLVGGGKTSPSTFSASTTTLTKNSKNIATATKKSMRLNYEYQNLWKIIAIENRKNSGKSEEEKICKAWRP